MQNNFRRKYLRLFYERMYKALLKRLKALEKIQSDKVELNIISQGVGQISESDVQLGCDIESLYHWLPHCYRKLMLNL